MVNNSGLIIHKIGYKKGRIHDYNIYKENLPVIPKQVVNVVDLGYLGIEKDYPEQLSSYLIKRKETMSCPKKKKKSTTNFIPKKRG